MVPTETGEEDYFDAIASKLEDREAYLDYLASRLGERRKRRPPEPSGVRPVVKGEAFRERETKKTRKLA